MIAHIPCIFTVYNVSSCDLRVSPLNHHHDQDNKHIQKTQRYPCVPLPSFMSTFLCSHLVSPRQPPSCFLLPHFTAFYSYIPWNHRVYTLPSEIFHSTRLFHDPSSPHVSTKNSSSLLHKFNYIDMLQFIHIQGNANSGFFNN